MTKSFNTVPEYSRQAAQEFLQTVVFVDDRIYQEQTSQSAEPKVAVVPNKRKKATKTALQPSATTSIDVSDDQQETSPDSYDIVTSFAKKQIICSLYQPKKTARVSPASDIFPLCKAADIVIVDWDLYGDKGERALELVSGLIKQAIDDVPEQLRLILVYTQEVNLFAIANDLFEKVENSVGDDIKVFDEGLAFHTTNSRVSVIGKPGRDRPDVDEKHIVEENKLAEVAIDEFSLLASGLLHAVMLNGLAEIRKNSRKILSKFNSRLDPAFLTHRAMSLPDEDASTHLVPLLVSEIEAVLEDSLQNPVIVEALIKDWCQNTWEPGEHVSGLIGENGNEREVASSYCLKGSRMKEDYSNIPLVNQLIDNKYNWKSDRAKIRRLSSVLLESESSTENHEFSRLMSSRTFYGKSNKTLKLGTIVRTDKTADNRYFMCLQPICDSVRMKEQRNFLFVELDKISSEDGKHKSSHILLTVDGNPTDLFYQPKVHKSYIAEFSPDENRKQVMSTCKEDGKEVFKGKDEVSYIWVDQLKTSHAQRAVEKFARELSRVGLTESEWQRFLDK